MTPMPNEMSSNKEETFYQENTVRQTDHTRILDNMQQMIRNELPEIKRSTQRLLKSELTKGKSFGISTLDDNLLRNIFALLPFEELKTLRSMHSKWNKIISESANFTSQCQLNVDNCLINENCPPWTTLRESTLKNPLHLVVGDGTSTKEQPVTARKRHYRTYLEFFMEFGINVHCITYNGTMRENRAHPRLHFNDVIMLLPNLRKIILSHFTTIFKFYAPASVETIHINSKDKIPQQVTKKQLLWIQNMIYLKYLTATQVLAMKGKGSTLFNLSEQLEQLLETDKQEIVIGCRKSFNFLTGLPLELYDIERIDNLDVKLLCEFPNIKELALLSSSTTGCFFQHCDAKLENIRAVKLNSTPDTVTICQSCLVTFKQSCHPNITEFSYIGVKSIDLQELIPNANLLETLTFDSKLGPFPIMPCLKKVSFVGTDLWKSQDLVSFTRKCPNVKRLEMSKISLRELEIIGKGWKSLEQLKVRFAGIYHLSVVTDTLRRHFTKLRILEFKSRNFIETRVVASVEFYIFRMVPSLRKINEVTYGAYCRDHPEYFSSGGDQ